MKKVFTDAHHIAHLWASPNNDQTEARTPRNTFFFDGVSIYSYGYHFPIARHVENAKGEKAVLFADESCSVTTAKHMRIVEGASSHINKIYCKYPGTNSHTENFLYFSRLMEYEARKLDTARKPEIYLTNIARINAKAVKYATFFGLKVPKEIKDFAALENREGFVKLYGKRIAAEKRAEAKRIKDLNIAIAKDLEKFRNFESATLYYRNGVDYLRYNAKTNRIETSQKVEIPVDIAQRFYNRIRALIASGGCTNCEEKLMDYQVRDINADHITVGCHTIKAGEIEMIAKLLQWPV